MAIPYMFPDGRGVRDQVRLARDIHENVGVYAEAQLLEVSLDGERVQVFTLPGFKPSPAAPGRRRRPPRSQAPTPSRISRRAGRGAAGAAGPGRPPRPAISQIDTGPRLSARSANSATTPTTPGTCACA